MSHSIMQVVARRISRLMSSLLAGHAAYEPHLSAIVWDIVLPLAATAAALGFAALPRGT